MRKAWREKLRPSNWPHAVSWRARLVAQILRVIARTRLTDFTRHPPLLVYQMGKVGSTSVRTSLEAAPLPYAIFHAHHLSDAGLANMLERLRLDRSWVGPGYHLGRGLRARLEGGRRLRWRVVTLVRDPIARTLSAAFQRQVSPRSPIENAAKEPDAELALASIEAQLADPEQAGAFVDGWFDSELRAVFGVDVYAHPFDPARGYCIIREPYVEVLVLRCEDLARTAEPALREFLATDAVFALAHENRTALKGAAGAVYREVRARLLVPPSVCAAIYAGRVAQHFYTETERAAFTERWSEGPRG